MGTQIRRGEEVYEVNWYVSCKRRATDTRGIMLAGPFDTHLEAESHKGEATRRAEEADPQASFYAYGLASAPVETIPHVAFEDIGHPELAYLTS